MLACTSKENTTNNSFSDYNLKLHIILLSKNILNYTSITKLNEYIDYLS